MSGPIPPHSKSSDWIRLLGTMPSQALGTSQYGDLTTSIPVLDCLHGDFFFSSYVLLEFPMLQHVSVACHSASTRRVRFCLLCTLRSGSCSCQVSPGPPVLQAEWTHLSQLLLISLSFISILVYMLPKSARISLRDQLKQQISKETWRQWKLRVFNPFLTFLLLPTVSLCSGLSAHHFQ